MQRVILAGVFLILVWGCARVRFEAPKEPIKMDITMRLDIYQHVAKDIDAIEDMVSGPKEKAAPAGNQSMLDYFLGKAYAQEALGPDVEGAALRRKDRRATLVSWEEKGIVGEDRSGLVTIRLTESADASLQELVSAENNDRMIIYQAVSRKNNVPLEEVQKLYAKRLHDDAPGGAPIEVLNTASAQYEWIKK